MRLTPPQLGRSPLSPGAPSVPSASDLTPLPLRRGSGCELAVAAGWPELSVQSSQGLFLRSCLAGETLFVQNQSWTIKLQTTVTSTPTGP